MENMKSMIVNIRMLIVDEISDRLEYQMKNQFEPDEDQLSEIAKSIAQEVKDNTLDQIEACIETEIDLSVDILWEKMIDKWGINEKEDTSLEDDAWLSTDENGKLIDEIPEEYRQESGPARSCPGCCGPAEKINEKEGIQTHIVDMEW